jgi:hypothetical protein
MGYSSDCFLYLPPLRRTEGAALLILRDRFVASTKTEVYGGEDRAIQYFATEVLRELSLWISVLEYVRRLTRRVERLRERAFKHVGSRRLVGRLKGSVSLSHEILELELRIGRLKAEIDRIGRGENEYTGEMLELWTIPGASRENLAKSMKDHVASLLGLLEDQIGFVHRAHGEYLTLRNVATNESIQRWVMALTVFMAAVVVVDHWTQVVRMAAAVRSLVGLWK